MAQDNKRNETRFDDMSNVDLIAFIGSDVDPRTSRTDLIVMAIEADSRR